jgi:predicted NAD/FAD-binding protein
LCPLNPPRPIAPEKILYETVYRHPLYTATSVETHALLPQVQNRRGMAWAGAWCGYGFHEDGLLSALRAVQALDPACLPEWAALGAAQPAPVAGEPRPLGNDDAEPAVEVA